MPPTDPILEEIHAIREALAKDEGYDPETIAEAVRRRQTESGRSAVTLPPQRTTIAKKTS